MIDYIERLTSLGFIMDNGLIIDLFFKSHLDLYLTFIMNYLISKKDKSLLEFLNMLRTNEWEIKKTTNMPIVKAKNIYG